MGWLQSAWRWMTGASATSLVVSETRALPESVGALGQSLITQVSQSGRPPVRGTQELLQVYARNPRIQAAVGTIATSVAAVPWAAYRVKKKPTRTRGAIAATWKKPLIRKAVMKRLAEEGDLEQLDGHPVLDVLNRPSPVFTGSEVRETMLMHLELVGECFAIIERAGSLPAELWPIPPHWAKELPSGREPFYTLKGPDWGPKKVAPEEILWIRRINPLNPYGRGTGLTGSLANELDADEYAALTTSSRMFNGMIPDLLVMLTNGNKEETARLKEKWISENSGPKRQNNVFFTNASDMKVQTLSPSLVDMDLVNLRQFEASVIRETFGVPPEILGHLENSNRATIEAAELIMAVYVQVPRLNKLEDAFNARICPQFGEDVILCYESPVPDDWEFRLKAAIAQPAALTVDEWRMLQGLEAHTSPKVGAQHFVAFGVSLSTLEDLATEPKPAADPFADNAGGEEEDEPDADAETDKPSEEDEPEADAEDEAA